MRWTAHAASLRECPCPDSFPNCIVALQKAKHFLDKWKWEQARDVCNRALQLHESLLGNDARCCLHTMRGLAAYHLNDWAQLLFDALVAVGLNPNHDEALQLRSLAHETIGDYPAALQVESAPWFVCFYHPL